VCDVFLVEDVDVLALGEGEKVGGDTGQVGDEVLFGRVVGKGGWGGWGGEGGDGEGGGGGWGGGWGYEVWGWGYD
jgi:hypothetical protein